MNWASLGTAKINEKIAPLVNTLDGQEFLGVSSRSSENAAKQTRLLNLKKSYSDYDSVLKDPQVHIIYNSLPNALHAEWTLKALHAGKHVLCEKPLAMKASEIEEIIRLSKAKKLCVMEGLMYRHHGQLDYLKSIISKIGPIHTLKMSFHTILPQGDNNIRWDKNLGGGALWDLGCYVVHCLRSLMNCKVLNVSGRAQFKNGVDEFFWGQIEFANAAHAFFDIGFNNVRRESLEIIGQNAVVIVPRPIKAQNLERIQVLRGRQDIEELSFEYAEDPYKAQLINFINCIKGTASAKLTLEDSLDNARCLEQFAQVLSAGL